MNDIIRFATDENGATAIEYGLLAGLVSIAIISALAVLNEEIAVLYLEFAAALLKAANP